MLLECGFIKLEGEKKDGAKERRAQLRAVGLEKQATAAALPARPDRGGKPVARRCAAAWRPFRYCPQMHCQTA